MWRDVFLHNKPAVLELIGRYVENLSALQRSIRRNEADALFASFASARAIHRGEAHAGGASSPGTP